MKLELKLFDEMVLEMSFDWLKDEQLKRLTDTPDISKEAQQKWFNTLPLRKDYLVRSVHADDQPVGAMGLKSINEVEKHAEYFGYLGKKEYWGKGIGNWMLMKAVEIAKERGLLKLYLNVVVENYIAINLYFKQGFQISKYDGKKFTMEKYI